MVAAVIADIVGSRRLEDRAAAQRILDASITRLEDVEPALERLAPTVGDEQQGVYQTLEQALTALLLLQLALPDAVACRFGIGIGEVHSISASGGDIPEGPGWWAAREAIDHVHEMQLRAAPLARTWIVAAPGEDVGMRSNLATANAYLLVRDQIVGSMSERERRLTYGRYLGRTQRQMADEEQITQSAVSQALSSAGSAAIVQSLAALRGESAGGRRPRS